ncbi:unnamed protein product [Gordionus sp. m RMFG-2023]
MHVEKIIESLNLKKHPKENGYSKEIFRSKLYVDYPPSNEKRNFCAGLYYLLSGRDYSPWHRLKNSESLWMYHSGSTLNIYMLSIEGEFVLKKLGNKMATRDPLANYQVYIPANIWFACEVEDKTSYCLATITISPSYEEEEFEMSSQEELYKLYPKQKELIQRFFRTTPMILDKSESLLDPEEFNEQNCLEMQNGVKEKDEDILTMQNVDSNYDSHESSLYNGEPRSNGISHVEDDTSHISLNGKFNGISPKCSNDKEIDSNVFQFTSQQEDDGIEELDEPLKSEETSDSRLTR